MRAALRPLGAALLAGVALAASGEAGPARQRQAHLRRGVNLSEWFAQVWDPKGYTPEHFAAWTTERDLALLRTLGFDHVRLSVNPQPFFRDKQADRLPAEALAPLDAALKMILDHGLAVMLDVHPDSDFKRKLATDDEFVEQFTDFWRGLAGRYAALDPERVVFELLNEPELRDRARWAGIQAGLAAAVREVAPRHTLIAAGARWSASDELLALAPLRDPNVVYAFHFYEPHIFTHQGATWGENYWHHLGGLPYPSDPAGVEPLLAQVPDPVHRLALLRYGLDRWNAERIEAEIGQVAAWARRWDAPVVCNELGVYRRSAAPQARARWLRDVRTALEKQGFGWTMWDYSGGFGLVKKTDGQPDVDELTLQALGLEPPRGRP